MKTENDIYKDCCGIDENGEPNAICILKHSIINNSKEEDKEENVVEEASFDQAIVKIHRGFVFTTVDFEFNSITEYDYIKVRKLLDNFTQPENSVINDNSDIPTLVLTVFAKNDEDYFVCGAHASWCLITPLNSDEATIVRFIFENKYIGAYELDIPEEEQALLEKEIYIMKEYEEGE